jgi:hypothetical protein
VEKFGHQPLLVRGIIRQNRSRLFYYLLQRNPPFKFSGTLSSINSGFPRRRLSKYNRVRYNFRSLILLCIFRRLI